MSKSAIKKNAILFIIFCVKFVNLLQKYDLFGDNEYMESLQDDGKIPIITYLGIISSESLVVQIIFINFAANI